MSLPRAFPILLDLFRKYNSSLTLLWPWLMMLCIYHFFPQFTAYHHLQSWPKNLVLLLVTGFCATDILTLLDMKDIVGYFCFLGGIVYNVLSSCSRWRAICCTTWPLRWGRLIDAQSHRLRNNFSPFQKQSLVCY